MKKLIVDKPSSVHKKVSYVCDCSPQIVRECVYRWFLSSSGCPNCLYKTRLNKIYEKLKCFGDDGFTAKEASVVFGNSEYWVARSVIGLLRNKDLITEQKGSEETRYFLEEIDSGSQTKKIETLPPKEAQENVGKQEEAQDGWEFKLFGNDAKMCKHGGSILYASNTSSPRLGSPDGVHPSKLRHGAVAALIKKVKSFFSTRE